MTFRTIEVKLVAETSAFRAQLGAAAASTQQFGTEVVKAASSGEEAFQQLGKTGVVVGGVIAAGFALSAKAAMDFESAFAGVRKTVTGSEAEIGALRDGIRDMAKELPASATEIAGVAEAAGQLGIQTGAILDFTRTMVDLGETTNMGASEAATQLARLANITQMSEGDFDRLGSTVVELGNNLATTEGEIVAMGLRLAGAGNQIGLAESEILAIAGALSSVGIEAEAGGSAISKVMIDIAAEVETGGDKLATFAQVAGMSSETFSNAYRENASGAIVAFVEGLGRMEEQGGSTLGVLADLGIEEVRMRDALLRASGAGDLLRESLNLGASAWKDNTALAAEAEQRYQTTSAQLEILRNNATDLAIGLGDGLLPVMRGMASSTTGLLEGFSALPGPVQTVVAGIAALSGAAALAGGTFLTVAPRLEAARLSMDRIAVSAPRAAAGVRLLGSGLGVLGAALPGIGASMSLLASIERQGTKALTGFMDALPEADDLGGRARNINAMIREYERLQEVAAGGIQGAIGGGGLTEAWQDFNPWVDNTISNAERATHKFAEAIDAAQAEYERLERTVVPLTTATGRSQEYILDLAESIGVDLAQGGIRGVQSILAVAEAERALGAGIPEVERMTMTLEEQEAALEALQERYETFGESIGSFTDPTRAWDTIASSAEDVARKHAEERAKIENEAVDDRVEAARDGADAVAQQIEREAQDHIALADLTGVAAEAVRRAARDKADGVRAAADDEIEALNESKTSWEEYYAGFTVSTEQWMSEMQAQVEAQQAWRQNVVSIAASGRRDVAEILAGMGPEGAEQAARFVELTGGEFQHAADLFVQTMTDGGAEAGEALDRELKVMAAIGRAGASATAEGIAAALNVGLEDVKTIAFGYGIVLAEAFALVGGVGGATNTGRMGGVPIHANSGMLVPGSGDTDTVPAMLTPGEFVVRKGAVRLIGVDRLAHMNQTGQVPGYAAGGLVNRAGPLPDHNYATPLTSATPAIDYDRMAQAILSAANRLGDREMNVTVNAPATPSFNERDLAHEMRNAEYLGGW